MCECELGPLTPRESEYERPIPRPRSYFRELGRATKPNEVHEKEIKIQDVIGKKLSFVSGDTNLFRAKFSIV